MNELWKPVLGFEGVYAVSNFGRVKRLIKNTSTHAGKILKPDTSSPYLRVTLFLDGRRFRKLLHEVVCEAFHGPRPPGHEVNHKDKKIRNCDENNLEWMTPTANHVHANGRHMKVTSPTGKTFAIHGLRPFCREYDLDAGAMLAVANGIYSQHKGWKCSYLKERVRL